MIGMRIMKRTGVTGMLALGLATLVASPANAGTTHTYRFYLADRVSLHQAVSGINHVMNTTSDVHTWRCRLLGFSQSGWDHLSCSTGAGVVGDIQPIGPSKVRIKLTGLIHQTVVGSWMKRARKYLVIR